MGEAAEELQSEAFLSPGAVRIAADGSPSLLGNYCRTCGTRMFPCAPVCPSCMGENLAEEEMPRSGIVYTFSIVHVGRGRWSLPMTIGYVDLPNGVRVLAHLKGAPAIGGTATLALDTVGKMEDGRSLTSFVFVAEAT